MDRNITVDEYKKILKNVEDAALEDMKETETYGTNESGEPVLSMLGMDTKSRDAEDYDFEHYEGHTLYADFDALSINISENIESMLDFVVPHRSSPVPEAFYIRVCRYAQFSGDMEVLYYVYIGLDGEMFSVVPNYNFLLYFEQCEEKVRQTMYISPASEYILKNGRQLMQPWNVILPYKPGDILYVDTNPFKAPFYAVYCGENVEDRGRCRKCQAEDRREHGEYEMRTHPVLYASGKDKKLKMTHLWRCGWYWDHSLSDIDDGSSNEYSFSRVGCPDTSSKERLIYPHAPYDHLTLVETCDDPDIKAASEQLKKNPDIRPEFFGLQLEGDESCE